MKEILFKAKVIYSGEWIEGYLCKEREAKNETTFIWYHAIQVHKNYDYGTGYYNYANYRIYPETASQYTGLKDKNGNKIFEGDIVRCWSGKEEDCLDFRELIGVVEYKAPYWVIKNNQLWHSAENFEIIGNIHDDAPYLMSEYNEAKEKGLDLDNWSDYEKYFGLGEQEEE